MSECVGEEILQSYLDGELAGGNLQSVSAHLASCLTCSVVVRELEQENKLVAAALSPEFEASVPGKRLRHRIDAAIAGAGQFRQVSSGAVETSVAVGLRGWLGSLFDFTPQRAFGYAGLLAVLTFAVIFAVVQRRNTPITLGGNDVALVDKGTERRAPGPGSDSTAAVVPPAPVKAPVQKMARGTGSTSSRSRNVATRLPSGTSATVANHVRLLPGERTYLQTIADLDSTIKLDKGQMKPALQAEYERNLAFVDRALAAARTAAKSNPNDPDAAQFMFSAYQSKVDLLNTVADARVYDKQR